MAAALVGTFTAAEGLGTLTTGSRTTTAGNLITGHGGTYIFGTAGGSTIVISDNKANTLTEANELGIVVAGDGVRVAMAYNANGTRGTSHTLTLTPSAGGSSAGSLVGHEWSGVEAAPTVVSNTASGTGTAVSVSATAGASSIFIGTMVYGGASTTIAPNGSTQASETDENSDNQAQAVAYRLSLTGAQSVAWTLAASRQWAAIVSAFTETSSGVNGVLNATLDAVTTTATGSLTNRGALAATVADVTTTATGFTTNRGALSATLDDVTLTATGVSSVTNNGALNATLDDVTLSAVGVLTIRGAVSATLDAFTTTATGSVTNRGQVSATLDDVTLSASGFVTNRGAVSATLDDVTLTATGVLGASNNGTLNATLDDVTLSAVGVLTNRGALNATLADVTTTAVGVLTNRGQVSATLDAFTTTATGSITNRGALNATLDDVTLSAAGGQGSASVGELVMTLDDVTLTATATSGTPEPARGGVLIADWWESERRRRRKRREDEDEETDEPSPPPALLPPARPTTLESDLRRLDALIAKQERAKALRRAPSTTPRPTLRLKRPARAPVDEAAVEREIAKILRQRDDEEMAIAVALLTMFD